MRQASFTVALFAISMSAVWGQRIPAQWDGSRMILNGQVPIAANQGSDRGPVDPALPIHSVSLIFNKTAEQQADFERLLAAQQNPRSADYMRWLTPAQYADRFGLDPISLSNVRVWLEGQGFSINAA